MKTQKWLCLAILLLAGCSDPHRLLEENTKLPARHWTIQDTLRYHVRIYDIAPVYQLDYQVRNTLEYPYSRLFVFYSLTDSTGRLVAKNTVAHHLFHSKTGKPHGSSGLGDLYDHRLPLIDSLRFERNGKYTISLIHQMRVDTLPGLAAVGVRLARKKK